MTGALTQGHCWKSVQLLLAIITLSFNNEDTQSCENKTSLNLTHRQAPQPPQLWVVQGSPWREGQVGVSFLSCPPLLPPLGLELAEEEEVAGKGRWLLMATGDLASGSLA